MTRTLLAALLLVGLAGVTGGQPQAQPVSSPRRGAAKAASLIPATGSYERDYKGKYSGNLEVQELPGGRIKFQLLAYGRLSDPGGPTMGEIDGVATLRREIAAYQYGEGRIAMRFEGRKVVVSQYGEITLGMGVVAEGTYTRKSKKPDFEPSINDM